MDTVIQETIEEILKRLCTPFRKVMLVRVDEKTFRVNIESEEPSLLIGHHGENIYALQNIVRTILWQKEEFNEVSVIIDVDNYRKRQEDNVIKLAVRKVGMVQNSGEAQSLPPMSPYFRRVIHLHIASNYDDIETESIGEGDFRYLMLKPKTSEEL